MKICGIICEFNPLHNGHCYLLQQAKQYSDITLCIMSGNFTQRGSLAILEKSLRARHAILAGADIVIELPTIYTLSSAEFFAKGAIYILNAIPAVQSLIFGTENDDISLLQKMANFQENSDFQSIITQQLKKGNSYIQSKMKTLQQLHLPELAHLSSTPNNILAIAYLKAIQNLKADITAIPLLRKGAAYADSTLYNNFSSATAIRKAVYHNQFEEIQNNLPEYVLKDLKSLTNSNNPSLFNDLAIYSILQNKGYFTNIQDCNEGLENRLYTLAQKYMNYTKVLQEATCKRYTTTRIARIFANAVLQIDRQLLHNSFDHALYLKVLAVKKSKMQQSLSLLSQSSFPLITEGKMQKNLSIFASKVYQKDVFAQQIYQLCYKQSAQKMQIVDI